MSATAKESQKLKVFVSYSRDDLQFADQLVAGLGLCGFDAFLDRTGISGGEAWQQRLGTMIREADTVVFVLSPASAASPVCKWEVEEAAHLAKRILPVLCTPLGGIMPPPQLAGLNYIYFYPEAEAPGSGFGTGLVRIAAALNTDLAWVREHTRLLVRASEWEAGGRPPNRLLSGSDITVAKEWAARRPKDAPAVADLHLNFINASEQAETARDNAERKRLEDMAQAYAAREDALKAAEAAQKEKAEATKRVVRRTVLGLVAAVILSIFASGLGFLAYVKQQQAVKEAERARKNLGAVKEALAVYDNASNPEIVASKFFELGRNYQEQGALEEASTLFERSFALVEKLRGTDDPDAAALRYVVAQVELERGQLSAAETQLRAALEFHQKHDFADASGAASVLSSLERALSAQGRKPEASEIAARLDQLAQAKAFVTTPVFFGTDRAMETVSKSDGQSWLAHWARWLDGQASNAPQKSGPGGLGFGSEHAHRLQTGYAELLTPNSMSKPYVPFAKNEGGLREALSPQATIRSYKFLAGPEFAEGVRRTAGAGQPAPEHALVIVHGFNTSFETAIRNAQIFAQRTHSSQMPLLYSWPSGGTFASYVYDRGSVDQAEPQFVDFLHTVAAATGAKKVDIVAFNVGCELVMRALERASKETQDASTIGEVVLVAPDVDRDRLDMAVRRIAPSAKGITVYQVKGDLALEYASRLWAGAPRAGTPSEGNPYVLRGADVIDMSQLGSGTTSASEASTRAVGAGSSPLWEDIATLLSSGIHPPDKRSPNLMRVDIENGSYWTYKPAGGP